MCTDMPRRNQTPKHLPYKRIQAVHSKQRFNNQVDAHDAAELRMFEHPELKLHVYKCPECFGWHLTRDKDI